jgi:hypothetical protein
MHKKAAIRKQIEGWRGKQFTEDDANVFDVASILGKSCMLTITDNESSGTIYSNITSIGQLPKGAAQVKSELPLRYYAPDDVSCFNDLPEWIREKINNQVKPQVSSDPSNGYSDDSQPPTDSYENDAPSDDTLITDEDIPF